MAAGRFECRISQNALLIGSSEIRCSVMRQELGVLYHMNIVLYHMHIVLYHMHIVLYHMHILL